MDQSEKVLGDFFSKQSEDDKQRRQKVVDSARSSERIDLTISGTYRMKADTFYYTKDNKFVAMPEMRISSNKKALQLAIPLRVVDGTPTVPRGALYYYNITLSPPPEASDEKFATIMGMAKPRIAALLGHDKIEFSKEWFEENLIPKYKHDGDVHTLVRDHKLQQEVMVEIFDDFYDNRDALSVKSVVPAVEGNHSISNKPVEKADEISDLHAKIMDNGDAEVVEADIIAAEAVEEGMDGVGDGDIDGTVNVEDF